MAQILLKGNPINTNGELPKVGSKAPDFELVKTDLSALSSSDLRGKQVVLNIFPSLDTPVCAASVRRFNVEAGKLEGVEVVCASMDLPFAHGRFCSSEGIENVVNASDFRTGKFAQSYGVEIVDGPMAGLMARAIVILDAEGTVTYTELVPEIVEEPNYEAALKAIG